MQEWFSRVVTSSQRRDGVVSYGSVDALQFFVTLCMGLSVYVYGVISQMCWQAFFTSIVPKATWFMISVFCRSSTFQGDVQNLKSDRSVRLSIRHVLILDIWTCLRRRLPETWVKVHEIQQMVHIMDVLQTGLTTKMTLKYLWHWTYCWLASSSTSPLAWRGTLVRQCWHEQS